MKNDVLSLAAVIFVIGVIVSSFTGKAKSDKFPEPSSELHQGVTMTSR